jgi:hypothetical protein
MDSAAGSVKLSLQSPSPLLRKAESPMVHRLRPPIYVACFALPACTASLHPDCLLDTIRPRSAILQEAGNGYDGEDSPCVRQTTNSVQEKRPRYPTTDPFVEIEPNPIKRTIPSLCAWTLEAGTVKSTLAKSNQSPAATASATTEASPTYVTVYAFVIWDHDRGATAIYPRMATR